MTHLWIGNFNECDCEMRKYHKENPDHKGSHILIMKGENLIGLDGPVTVHLCRDWKRVLGRNGVDILQKLETRLGQRRCKKVRHL